MHEPSAYGLWALALVNSLVFVIFALSFVRPRSPRDWRSLGAFAGFVVALFAEMYGFPLTIYLLSGWLQTRYPALDPMSHDAGHLWWTLFRFGGDPHLNPVHVAGNLLVFGGFIVLAAAWRVLHDAQARGELATGGLYARLRHPQYAAFIAVMAGFLLQWPTLLTLLMFPVLVAMYVRLARREDAEAEARFGDRWRAWARRTPAWWPRLGARPRDA